MSFSAHALSDRYYSEGLDIEFALPEDDASLKTKLEGVLNKLARFISQTPEGGMGFDLDYFTKMDQQTEHYD